MDVLDARLREQAYLAKADYRLPTSALGPGLDPGSTL